jgi:hypothetical protein
MVDTKPIVRPGGTVLYVIDLVLLSLHNKIGIKTIVRSFVEVLDREAYVISAVLPRELIQAKSLQRGPNAVRAWFRNVIGEDTGLLFIRGLMPTPFCQLAFTTISRYDGEKLRSAGLLTLKGTVPRTAGRLQ